MIEKQNFPKISYNENYLKIIWVSLKEKKHSSTKMQEIPKIQNNKLPLLLITCLFQDGHS
jgi:hypothetical protein